MIILFPCKKLPFGNKLEGIHSCLFEWPFKFVRKFFNHEAVKLFGYKIFKTYLMVNYDGGEQRPIRFFRNSNLQVEIKFNCKFHDLKFRWFNVFGLLVHRQGRDLLSTERPVLTTPGLRTVKFNQILTC